MLNFLNQTRKLLNVKEAVCVVLGNESCDLDSVCSALCLAYLLERGRGDEYLKHIKSKRFLPVLNIPRRDYPIKTEVNYLLRKNNIQEGCLTFRDELHEDFLARSEFILVDHHESPFIAKTVAVYDHRPRDINVAFPKDCYVKIELVGSCATLIAEEFFNQICVTADLRTNGITYSLLRDTIILDTVNFSPSAARFTTKDEQILSRLESLLEGLFVIECESKPDIESREEIFYLLRRARADVSSLTASQLLRKDLKVLTSSKGGAVVALPGFPLQVQQFIKKSGAEDALLDFANERNCNIVLLLGMFVAKDGSVERDMGLISIGDNMKLRDFIEARLLTSNDPLVDLDRYENCNFMDGHYYRQKNIKATRKHILPIVMKALENWQTEK